MGNIEDLKKGIEAALNTDSNNSGLMGDQKLSQNPQVNAVAKPQTDKTNQMKAISDALSGAGDIVKAVQDGVQKAQQTAENKPLQTQTQPALPKPPMPPINPGIDATNAIGAARAPQIRAESKTSNQRRK